MVSKSIFARRRKEERKKLNKTKSITKAFSIGFNTSKKIEQDLWKMSKKQLQKQKELAKRKEDKNSVNLVLEEKFKQDRKLKNKLG